MRFARCLRFSLFLIVVLATVTLTAFSAATAEKNKPELAKGFGYFMSFSYDGEDLKVLVFLTKMPAVLHGTEGGLFKRLTPDDVRAMEAALASEEAQAFFTRHGIDTDRALAEQVFGTAIAPNRLPSVVESATQNANSCTFMVDIADRDGPVFDQVAIKLEDEFTPYVVDDTGPEPVRRMRFSARDAVRIMQAMRNAGYASLAPEVLVNSLKVSPPASTKDTSFYAVGLATVQLKPTDPDCGECEYGMMCNGDKDCCVSSGTVNCIHCKACPS